MLGITRISLLVILAAVSTGASAQFKVLHNFSGADGASPNALIQTADGFFYGSAANGGDVNACSPDGCGTLFKSDSAGNVTVLHVFHASDGYSPRGLVKGSDGNFYGTTTSGGQPSGGGAGTKTKHAFTIKALNVGAAQTFHVYTFAAGQGVRTTLTALP